MAIQSNNQNTATKKTADAWVNLPIYAKDKDGNDHYIGKASLPLYKDDPVHGALITKREAEGNGTDSDIQLVITADIHVVAAKPDVAPVF